MVVAVAVPVVTVAVATAAVVVAKVTTPRASSPTKASLLASIVIGTNTAPLVARGDRGGGEAGTKPKEAAASKKL